MAKRVLMLGPDGVPKTLFDRLMKEGRAPNLKKLMEKGAWMQMDTVIPTVSGVAWTAMQTGCGPGKHGIYGFAEFDPDLSLHIPNSRDIKVPVLGEILEKHGKRTISLGVPISYPPQRYDGVVVSDFLAPSLDGAVHPEKELKRLSEFNYVMDTDPIRARESLDYFKEELPLVFEARRKAIMYYLERNDWDLLLAHVMETDRINHFMLGRFFDDDPEVVEYFLDFYRKVDDLIGEVVEKKGDDVVLIVMSDHGFCPIKHDVQMNVWLQQENLQRIDDLGKMFAGISKDTKVLSLVPGRFYVLDENRYHQGNVRADEKEDIIKDLIDRLKNMKDPESGDPIIRRVFRKEEIFTGADLDTSPDVVVDPHDGYDLKAAPIGQLMVNTPINGMHTQYDSSLFIEGMKAPDRKPMIYDVTATILDIMGIDIPSHFDGSSLLS